MKIVIFSIEDVQKCISKSLENQEIGTFIPTKTPMNKDSNKKELGK